MYLSEKQDSIQTNFVVAKGLTNEQHSSKTRRIKPYFFRAYR